jgi:AhpD family alkylhydroperoxidase
MSHARKEYRDFMSLTPDAYEAVLALGQVAGKAGMDKQLLELIKLRASQINGCAFCVQYHILEAEKLGVPADKLNLVVVWREAPQFSQRERAALAWTEALTLLADGVSDEVYAQASSEFSGEGSRLSHLGGRLDQRLEPVRRRLPLDAAGAEAGGRRGGFVKLANALQQQY